MHVVQRGETLYKIAWQYRVDQQELANWNGIRDPDELRVGQRLRLVPPRGYVAAAPVPGGAPAGREPRARRSTARRAAPTTPAAFDVQRRAAQDRRRLLLGTARPRPRPREPGLRRGPRRPRPRRLRWSWPTDGRIVTRFGADDGIASGIGIGGREGQPVRAAAAGRVVYAGGGLIGYGQLVIIKHDETFLSAYGYNSELLVTQGQDVARGATIALMGQGPGRQPRLHFEVRRNGVPVDPLLFVSAPR